MKRIIGITLGFILLFSLTFYGVVKVKECYRTGCPLFFKNGSRFDYCCAQEGMCRKLTTTPLQQETLKSLDQEFLEEKGRLCKQLCQARYRLAQMLVKPTVTQQELEEKIAEVSAIQLAMERAAVAHILKVRDILTPDQAKSYMESLYQDACKNMEMESCGFAMPLENKGET